MPAKKAPSIPAPPSITKEQGRSRIDALVERGTTLLEQQPINESQWNIWNTACLETIRATFGKDTAHASTFVGTIRAVYAFAGSGYRQNEDSERKVSLQRRIEVLQSLSEQISVEIGFETPAIAPTQTDIFWTDIHRAIALVARARYDAGHYADCVEAALKEVNSIIKDHVKRKTGEELDGASLMRKAFSPNRPIITLEDQGTESGRNIQQGYMDIYAGAMIGVRNPVAFTSLLLVVGWRGCS